MTIGNHGSTIHLSSLFRTRDRRRVLYRSYYWRLNRIEGEDGRLRIQFDLGKVTLPDGRNISARLMREGSDRTLEMAQRGAEAIVQSRFHVFSKVVWRPELSPQP